VVELNPFKVWKLSTGAPQPPTIPINSFPTSAPSPPSGDQSGQHKGIPSSLIPAEFNSSVLMAAAVSVPLSLLIALCMAWRRWRKRGAGPEDLSWGQELECRGYLGQEQGGLQASQY